MEHGTNGHYTDALSRALAETATYQHLLSAAEVAQERDINVPDTTPLDVFGDSALVGSPRFPLGVFPAVVEDWAADVAYRLGVDTAMVALPMLGVCAASIDDRVQITPLAHDHSWKESARLWIAVIAESGQKKTPAINAALAPVRDVERHWLREDTEQRQQLSAQIAVQREAQKHQQRQLAKALASGKEIDLPELPSLPLLPPVRRKEIKDTTVEAVAELLVENPWGLLEVHDELSSWFGNFDAYRGRATGKDRALYLEAYNGGPNIIDRVGRGRVFVPNWSLSIIGGIQPGPMQRLAGQITDDGLVQRFMVVFTEQDGKSVDQAENAQAKHAYWNVISQLLSWNCGGPDARVLCSFSPSAHELREFLNDRVAQVRCMPWVSPAFHAHLAKWEGLFPRLCLTWHILQHGNDLWNLPREIPKETAERVCVFMLEYLLPHAARFYSEILQTKAEEGHARWIAGHILAHELDKISTRMIGRAFRTVRGETPVIQKSMEHLVALGWAVPMRDGTVGGPRKWQVNPKVHDLFSARAKAEKERRAEAIRQIQLAVQSFPVLGQTRAQE